MTFKHKLSKRLAQNWWRCTVGLPVVLGCSAAPNAPLASDATPVALRIHPRDITIRMGRTADFEAYAIYASGDSAVVDATWTTTGGLVTEARGNGKAKGRYQPDRPGRFKVKAEADSLSDSVSVDVTDITVAWVDVRPDSVRLTVGDTVVFDAIARDSSGAEMSDMTFTWAADAEAVVGVRDGVVTTRAAGVAVVAATVEGVAGSAVVVVDGAPSAGDSGAVRFQDDFESGDLSTSVDGYRWRVSNGGTGEVPQVSTDIARSGNYSLRFTFQGSANLADDAWSEQRFTFGDQLSEVYLQWYQYYPDGTEGLGARFVHRDATGPDNNKFLRLWDTEYGAYRVKLGFSTQWNGSADPKLITEMGTNQGGVDAQGLEQWRPGITDAYRGRWVQYRVHVRLATANGNDGVIRLWVDGNLVVSNTSVGMYPTGGVGNFLQNGYLVGWANTGFTQTTYTYIDDFVVSSAPIP